MFLLLAQLYPGWKYRELRMEYSRLDICRTAGFLPSVKPVPTSPKVRVLARTQVEEVLMQGASIHITRRLVHDRREALSLTMLPTSHRWELRHLQSELV